MWPPSIKWLILLTLHHWRRDTHRGSVKLFQINFKTTRYILKYNKKRSLAKNFEKEYKLSATKHADNNSKPIPNHYSILFKQ